MVDYYLVVLLGCTAENWSYQLLYLIIANAQSQCSAVTATMVGQKTGVATQIKRINQKWAFTHVVKITVIDMVKMKEVCWYVLHCK